MSIEYVEQRDGRFFVAETRVSLDSVVYAYLRGESPEGIADAFPALRLDQIFGALAFYTANREQVDRYLREARADFESLRQQWRSAHPGLVERLEQGRKLSIPGA